MAGRGGYYGSLHPAYQPFPEHGSLNMSLTRGEASGARCGGLQTPASSSSTSTKLDEILALLHNQEEKISSLTTEVADLKEELKQLKGKEKKSCVLVPKELSRLTNTIHESFNEEKQFDSTKLYLDKHNAGVRDAVIDEIKASGCECSSTEIKQAVYWCYDSKRRSWTDQQPSRQEQVTKNRRTESSKRAKQNQLYIRRAKYLKGREKEYWDSIDPSFMSEESAHESEGELVMHRHTPVYRSEGLNKLIEKLDNRYMKESAGKRSSAFKAFPRVVCSPAKRDPRPNAPTWAVKPLYQQGEASVEQVEQELTSTPVSPSSSRAVSSRQLSFSSISGEMPEGTVTSDSECELDGL